MQQAQRVSDRCAFFLAAENEPGRVVEQGATDQDVRRPRRPAHPRLRPRTVRVTALPHAHRRGVCSVALAAAGGSWSWSRLAMAVRAGRLGRQPSRRPTARGPPMPLWRSSSGPRGAEPGPEPQLHGHQLAGRAGGLRQNTADFAGTEAEFSELTPDANRTHVPRGSSTRQTSPGRRPSCTTSPLTATAGPGQLPPPVAADDRQDLPGRSSTTGTTPPSAPTTRAWSSPTSPSPSSVEPASRAPPRCSTTSSSTPTRATTRLGRAERVLHRTRGSWSRRQARRHRATLACQYSGSDQQAQHIAANRAVVHRLRRVRLRQGLQRQRRLGAERLGQLGAALRGNIAAALQSAVLAPDTSQNLTGVYTSTNPLAYPISAYSYILVQCAPTPTDRPV